MVQKLTAFETFSDAIIHDGSFTIKAVMAISRAISNGDLAINSERRARGQVEFFGDFCPIS